MADDPQAFPLALEIPTSLGFNSKTFQLGYIQQITPATAGYLQTLDRSTPMWTAEYTTPPLSNVRYDDTVAFLSKMRGSMFTFLAYDPRRTMPRAYQGQPLASDPWTQSGQEAPRIVGFDYADSTIQLDRMQNGAIITPGDYISFKYLGIWYLFRATARAVVSGNTANLSVQPQPFMPSIAATPIRYRKACCEMKIIGQPTETDSVDSLPYFSFKASQFINRSNPVVEDTDVYIITENGFVLADEDGNEMVWA